MMERAPSNAPDTQKLIFGRDVGLYAACIDSGKASGELYNCYVNGPLPFTDLGDMVLQVNAVADLLTLPQASRTMNHIEPVRRRKASSPLSPLPKLQYEFKDLEAILMKPHQRTRLYIQLYARQNLSLQGMVKGIAGKNRFECCFRSALELISLTQEFLRQAKRF